MKRHTLTQAAFGVVLAVMLPLGSSAFAAAAAKDLPPEVVAAMGKPYTVKGFRSAMFGQTADQVTAAIAKDFGKVQIQHVNDAVNGVTASAVNLPSLAPAPGPATVTYVFGKDGKLVHVNVVWLITGNATPQQRAELTQAGVKLSGYFNLYKWPPKKVGTNIPTGPNAVSMFVAKDAGGNAVEVSLNGISFQRNVNGRVVASATPSGPARLRVAYGSAAETKATTQIAPGQF